MLKPRRKLTKKQIKEDKLVTYYFKASDYIEKNSKIVFGVTAVVLAAVVLIMLFNWSKRNAELSASLELTKAREELRNNQEEKAADILKSLIQNYSGTQSAGRAVYYLANIEYGQGNFDAAMAQYEKYIDDYNDDYLMSSSSYSGMAACMEAKQEYLTAAKYYKKGAEKYSENFEAVSQLMGAARCFKLANNNDEAKKMYQRIIENYPNSTQKRNAELYLSELQG